MQNYKNFLSVAELQKMIHVWKSRHITDSTVSKLLELYLGLTGYMNSRRVYPQENFYEIRNSLRFATTQALVQAVKLSASFPFVTDPDTGAVTAFWSPLYHCEGYEPSGEEPSGLSAQTFAQTFVETDNNIYNILSEERTSIRSSSLTEKSSADTAEPESASDFFHRINHDPEQKARILLPLVDRFQQQEHSDRSQACRTLVCLVNEQLIPYFTRHPQFPKIAHEGRLSWLENLLKSPYGSRMMTEAMHSSRQKRERASPPPKPEPPADLRGFRPLSPYEWTDRASERRFYDDDEEGFIPLPADAPPRPAATAQWDVLSRQWKGGDQ